MSDSLRPQTAACEAPLSVGFSRQDYWSELPCPPQFHSESILWLHAMKMSNMEGSSKSPNTSSLTTNSNETSGGHSGTPQPGGWKPGDRALSVQPRPDSDNHKGVLAWSRQAAAPLYRWAFYLFHISRLHLRIYFVEMSFLLKISAMETCCCDSIFQCLCFWGVGTPGGKSLLLEIQGWVDFIPFGDSRVPASVPQSHHIILSPLKNLMSEFLWKNSAFPRESDMHPQLAPRTTSGCVTLLTFLSFALFTYQRRQVVPPFFILFKLKHS